MRELHLVGEASTSTRLVLESDDGEQFILEVNDKVRDTLSTSTKLVDDTPTAPATTSMSRTSGVLTLSPREIQSRIRSGASVKELAEEMGVDEARVDTYAYPVLMERSQVADLARSSHPLRDDGPAKLTLSEVLAAAFGARGYSLADASWDAFKEPGGEWIVRVTWKAGLSVNEAEWVFHRSSPTSSAPATTQARNAVAADLTDPDFVQPVRSLSSVSRGVRHDESLATKRASNSSEADAPTSPTSLSHQDAVPGAVEDSAPAENSDDGMVEGEDLLQNPDSDQRPTGRRRKAVTPHWEDVLLGVRANTKRPKK